MSTEFKNLTNYEKLLRTADTLRFSQGYYGRLYESLQELTDDSIEELDNINELTNCKDTLDVVMYLEG